HVFPCYNQSGISPSAASTSGWLLQCVLQFWLRSLCTAIWILLQCVLQFRYLPNCVLFPLWVATPRWAAVLLDADTSMLLQVICGACAVLLVLGLHPLNAARDGYIFLLLL
ncbi:hypothetical protein U1Q18_030653, partial [Sarracenia purpurea var. burkii]